MDSIEIRGTSLPLIGFGTWELRGDECSRAVEMAYELGYRHFDTALLYENHATIRKALSGCKDLIYTSKFMPYHLDQMSVTEACEKSLEELGIECVDFFLMHYPDRSRPMKEIIVELSTLPAKGLAKCVGGSNFAIKHLEEVDKKMFALNQVEFHPYLNQKELLAYCKAHRIQLTSFRSLGKGALTEDPLFASVGKRYGKSPAQVSLRWLVQQKIPVIPKSTSKEHMQENLDVLNFAFSEEEMAQLSTLMQKPRFCQNAWSDY